MDKIKRNTKTKQLVMNVLENSKIALCHDDIVKHLHEKIDRVTIYRILQGFCDDGKIHRIVAEDGKSYYAVCRNCSGKRHNDYHPHFHCIACNAISCVDEQLVVQPLPEGYSITYTTSLISGYCPKCSNLGSETR
ncbi:MAG: transcriptional repressor [Dysgonamonadaceae bacterium]|jgi:Fe2+ or Zn2+ uptake regulation protein|nr:transcriptional repressor [Dysgonamonadaceae bacterium]